MKSSFCIISHKKHGITIPYPINFTSVYKVDREVEITGFRVVKGFLFISERYFFFLQKVIYTYLSILYGITKELLFSIENIVNDVFNGEKFKSKMVIQ